MLGSVGFFGALRRVDISCVVDGALGFGSTRAVFVGFVLKHGFGWLAVFGCVLICSQFRTKVITIARNRGIIDGVVR